MTVITLESSSEEAAKIISKVIQIDVSKYNTKITSNTAEVRDDLGGIIQKISGIVCRTTKASSS
jgi:hypothetical protein